MRNRRSGLTLVELVVAVFALGTLLSISLPAIQLGREGGDQIICRDNLRIIGLASAEYDDAFGELPPYMGVPWNQPGTSAVTAMAFNYQLTYSLTQLLDFIGYSDLTEQVDPFVFSSVDATIQSVGYVDFDPAWLAGISKKLPGIAAIAFGVQVPEFRCPADAEAPTKSAWIGPHPTDSSAMITFVLDGSDETDFSISNYVSNAGAIGITDTDSPLNQGFHGPIRSRRSDSIETIPDGASNVILFGESLGTIDESSNINRRYSMAMGGIAVGRASLYGGINTNFGSLKESSWIQFASGHANVVNFVLADGTVRSINRNIQSFTIGRMCGAADGLPFFAPALD